MLRFKVPFVLASQSPRRRQLLEMLKISFTVQVSELEEVVNPALSPAEVVADLALQKAEAVAQRYPDALVLAADTIVVLDGQILGKPRDPAEASQMLHALNGRSNLVFTGLALVHQATGRRVTAVEQSEVYFAEMTTAEIEAYVASGLPLDKAGAYGIQDDWGALFISGIQGDFYTVVGLPVHRLYATLKHAFSDLLAA